ncbi:MAG: NB-ARC domain-containing protein [Heteroscytonema crispum UTEX LB 1556]
MSNNPIVKKILILAANPKDTVRLRLDQEVRDIEQGLQLAAQRDKFTLHQKWAVRSRDISRAVLDFRPNIIHFSAHGSETEGLSFEDEIGKEKFVTGEALGGLFKLFANHVECVLLNACYSQVQANAIAQHIDYVIGMNQAIADKAALEFSVGFYDALARYDPQYDGDSPIEFAFNVACSSISLAGVSGASIPVLIKNPNPRKRNERRDNQLLGQLIGDVPNLPPHFLPREEQLNPLKNKVLADTNQPVAITAKSRHVGVQGMGGIGKTVLATALARDEEVRRAFPDGVIWITFGQTPQILTLQSDVVEALGDKQASFTEINLGKTQLRKLLTDKACLLILDDVWNLEHASAFDVLEKPCQMLITTRDAGIITALGGEEYQLSILNEQQALALLADWANQAVETLPTTAQEVAHECGYLPLALSLNGAMVRDGTSWEDLLEALREADLEFFEHPHGSILKSIKISIDALLPNEAQHYLELAVFPEDTAVPESTIVQLWTRSNQLSDRNARKLLTTLARKALLRTTGEAPQRKVELHDLQYDYLQNAVSNLSELHTQFLDAYTEKYPNGWHSLENDGYIFQNLAHHLIQAGRRTELQQLLFDFRWLQAKLENSNINELIADYNLLPEDVNLQLLRRTLVLSGHVLAEDKTQLAGQLWGRLQCFPASEIQQLLQQAKQNQTTWLRPLTSSLTSPCGLLLRVLTGHEGSVWSLAVTPDGEQVISGSEDGTVKIWSLNSGNLIRTIPAHNESVDAIVTTAAPDGLRIISGSHDKTIKIWNLKTGELVRTLAGHYGSINAIALTPDNSKMISASSDCSLKVWNLENGEALHTLVGHRASVQAVTVVFTNKKKWVISGSYNDTLRVWNLETGKEEFTLGDSDMVWSIAATRDGERVISASEDGTLTVWKVATWEKEYTLKSHSEPVRTVTVTSDGKQIISGSSDGTLKIWKADTWENKATISGHTAWVLAVAVTPDSKQIISASGNKLFSNDYTLKIWNLEKCDFSLDTEYDTKTAHDRSVEVVAFTPDGKQVISASKDNTIKIWKVETWENEATFRGESNSAYALGDYEHKEHFHLQAGQIECTLHSTRNTLPFLIATTTDGKRQIWTSGDETLLVWDVSLGKFIATFTGDSAIRCCAVASDRLTIVAGEQSGQLHFLQLEGVQSGTI